MARGGVGASHLRVKEAAHDARTRPLESSVVTTDSLREHTIKILEALRRDADRDCRRMEELERQGRRLITGGQTSGSDEDGRSSWEITDWRTNEVLAAGYGTYEEHAAAIGALPDNVFHLDHLPDQGLLEVSDTAGIPESLSDHLIEWVMEASAADVALVAGWSIDEVEAHRSPTLRP